MSTDPSSAAVTAEQLRDARAATEQARRRLELLAMAGVVFAGSLEPQATLEEIAALLVPAVADWCRVEDREVRQPGFGRPPHRPGRVARSAQAFDQRHAFARLDRV